MMKVKLNADSIDKAEIGEVKVAKTQYSPDYYLFDEKDEYVTYMLNEFPFVLPVTAFLAIRDNADYMPSKEYVSYLQADEKIQKNYKEFIYDIGDEDYTFEDFIGDDAFTDYIAENNKKLADDLEVGLTSTTGWHKNGPEYYLEGTWTALHTFCEKACGADGEPGEALYKYKQALDKLKDRILKIGEWAQSTIKENVTRQFVEDNKKYFPSSTDNAIFTVFLRDSGDGDLACQYYLGTSLKYAKNIFKRMCKEANDLQFSEETYWLELWKISTSPEIITPDVKDDIHKIQLCTEQEANAQKSRDAEQALNKLYTQGLAVQLDTYHYQYQYNKKI